MKIVGNNFGYIQLAITALFSATFIAWIQKQNFDPEQDDLLEMLVETYAKYS